MPTPLPASRACWLFCCAVLLTASPGIALAQNSPPKISIRLWVIEVESEKLRNLGFNWSQITPDGKWATRSVSTAGEIAGAVASTNAAEFNGFLKVLEQNSLAQTLAEPTLVTLSGRKASLQVGQQAGQQTKIEVTPTALDNQRVELQYQIEVGSEAESTQSAHVINASTVQVEAGKPCVISHTRSSSPSANGKRRQTEILLLVQADRLP